MVRLNWSAARDWKGNISEFTKAATVWNREVFGHIQRKKNRTLRRLHGI